MLCKECKYVQIKPFLMCDMTSLSLQFYVICNVRNAGIAHIFSMNTIYIDLLSCSMDVTSSKLRASADLLIV